MSVSDRGRRRIQDLITRGTQIDELLAMLLTQAEETNTKLARLSEQLSDLSVLLRKPLPATVAEITLPEEVRGALGLPDQYEDYMSKEENVTSTTKKTYEIRERELKRISKTGYVMHDGPASGDAADIVLEINRSSKLVTVKNGEKFEWGTGTTSNLAVWEITITTTVTNAQNFRLHAW